MNHSHAQRGSIILYAMLTMASMLAIGLTLNALFIGKLKSSAAARDSIAAVYAADSASELCLYEARKNEPQLAMTFTGDIMYSIVNASGDTDITDDCSVLGSSSFSFRATGVYRGVSRTLEISQ